MTDPALAAEFAAFWAGLDDEGLTDEQAMEAGIALARLDHPWRPDMPAAPHLAPIIDALGDGGSVDMAERVVALYGGTPDQLAANMAGSVGSDASVLVGDALLASAAEGGVVVTDVAPALDAPVTVEDAVLAGAGHLAAEAVASTSLDGETIDVGPVTVGEALSPEQVAAQADLNWTGPDDLAVAVAEEGLADDPDVDPDDDVDWDNEDAPKPMPGGGGEPDAPPAALKPEPTTAQIREWCLSNNVDVAVKGAVSKAARTAYDTAHQG